VGEKTLAVGSVFIKVLVILPSLIWPHGGLTFARGRPDVEGTLGPI